MSGINASNSRYFIYGTQLLEDNNSPVSFDTLRAGVYTLQLLNGDRQCYHNYKVEIGEPNELHAHFHAPKPYGNNTHIKCRGNDDGSIEATVPGDQGMLIGQI